MPETAPPGRSYKERWPDAARSADWLSGSTATFLLGSLAGLFGLPLLLGMTFADYPLVPAVIAVAAVAAIPLGRRSGRAGTLGRGIFRLGLFLVIVGLRRHRAVAARSRAVVADVRHRRLPGLVLRRAITGPGRRQRAGPCHGRVPCDRYRGRLRREPLGHPLRVAAGRDRPGDRRLVAAPSVGPQGAGLGSRGRSVARVPGLRHPQREDRQADRREQGGREQGDARGDRLRHPEGPANGHQQDADVQRQEPCA